MTDVILERSFEVPIAPDDVYRMARDGAWCFDLHKVAWQGSLLAVDGTRMVCWFRARDTESARTALIRSGADTRIVWPASVHDAPDLAPDAAEAANVLVERAFPSAVALADVQAIEDAGAHCLETHHVRFIRTFFSFNRQRMICLYRAPDAESVRLAQRQAGMPMERVWTFRAVPASG